MTVSLRGSSAPGALLQLELRFVLVEVILVRLLYGVTVASLAGAFSYFPSRGSWASERVENWWYDVGDTCPVAPSRYHVQWPFKHYPRAPRGVTEFNLERKKEKKKKEGKKRSRGSLVIEGSGGKFQCSFNAE